MSPKIAKIKYAVNIVYTFLLIIQTLTDNRAKAANDPKTADIS